MIFVLMQIGAIFRMWKNELKVMFPFAQWSIYLLYIELGPPFFIDTTGLIIDSAIGWPSWHTKNVFKIFATT